MKGFAQCTVAYRQQDLHLDSRATALLRKNDSSDHQQERKLMTDCQLLMEGFMRVPVTM